MAADNRRSMKHHLVLWSIALSAVLLASLVHVTRQTRARSGSLADDPEIVATAALALLDSDVNAVRGDTQDAIRAAAVLALEGRFSSAQGAYLLGRQYVREENFRAAEGQFKKAIALEPDWSLPYTGLGDLLGLHSFGRAGEAKEVLHKAIALDPAQGRSYGVLAVILRSEGRFDEALVQADLALKYMPEEISSLNNYGNLLLDLNRFSEAETYFRRANASFPEHPSPYYNLACLYARTGRRDEALANLREAFNRMDALRYEAPEDPDLASLRGDPEFDQLVFRDSAPPEHEAAAR